MLALLAYAKQDYGEQTCLKKNNIEHGLICIFICLPCLNLNVPFLRLEELCSHILNNISFNDKFY